MKTHAAAGARVLSGSSSPVLQMATIIAATHHERWDGAGYPAGLAGEAIPLVGRVVAVADVYDALTHDRPYKSAWPREQAIAEIRRAAGSQFDPQVAAAFLATHEAGHGRRRAPASRPSSPDARGPAALRPAPDSHTALARRHATGVGSVGLASVHGLDHHRASLRLRGALLACTRAERRGARARGLRAAVRLGGRAPGRRVDRGAHAPAGHSREGRGRARPRRLLVAAGSAQRRRGRWPGWPRGARARAGCACWRRSRRAARRRRSGTKSAAGGCGFGAPCCPTATRSTWWPRPATPTATRPWWWSPITTPHTAGWSFTPLCRGCSPSASPRLHERSSQSLPIMYATWLGPVMVALGSLLGRAGLLRAGSLLAAGAAGAMAGHRPQRGGARRQRQPERRRGARRAGPLAG